MKVFVDTAIPKSRRRKKHVAFDADNNRFIKVSNLSELLNYGFTDIYIDSLFSNIYNEILEILQKGGKVYFLKETASVKKARVENNLKKSDEIDAQVLSTIPINFFKEITTEEAELKSKVNPKISRYLNLKKRIAILKGWMRDEDDNVKERMKEVVKLLIKKRRRQVGRYFSL